MAKKKDVTLLGPLYTDEGPGSLGGTKVAPPTGGKSFPDPLNLNKTSSKG